ncbi:MAG TPA: UDP-N-acetylmuramoyl-tripeptide--D-alanyl-D-alanine ligase [Nocardioidaceae bacterium]|nr:UDP-N-acetylmuramoyl-tripeptide--D-alanyl-D-alanine ligase [Nocardioidaceae bacterium]
MIPMTLPEIAAVVGGDVHDDPGVTVTGPAFVDTRAPEAGGLFAAFVGANVDGHDYARAAVDAGAAAVLCSRPVGLPSVVVADPQAALAALAHHVLARLTDVRVVALTGSQGKTSTKDLLAQVLSRGGTTVATAGSFNNELGLPLTVLRADAETEFLVLEMGARGVGHLAPLCEVAPPNVSLVLNVGKAHIGEFGTQQDIAQAKGEIVEALGEDGVAVLNADDPLVAPMASRTRARVLTYGESAGVDVRLQGLELDALGRPRFKLAAGDRSADVELNLVGEHQAHNAAAAAAVALALGMSLEQAATALAQARTVSGGRMEVHERADGVMVINDAYNANPDSMRAALKALAAVGRGRGPQTRTVAVLGEMRELGESSRDEHDAVGRLAVRLDISQLLVVGEPARPMHLGACLEGSWGDESVFVATNEEALAWLREHLAPGDVVLLKASNAAALGAVAEALLADNDGGEKETTG